MIVLGIKSNIDAITASLNDFQKEQVPYATALALNRTAQFAKDTLVSAMKREFDRPSPFTLNSLYVKFATKTTLQARVEHKDFAGKGTPASKYLNPEIFGGGRGIKASERLLSWKAGQPAYWVPSKNIQLDAYGNVPGSTITKILSATKSFQETGFLANRRAKKQGARNIRAEYVVIKDGNPRGLKPGVYEHKYGALVPMLFFIKPPQYKARYDFYGTVERVVAAEFGRQFQATLEYALAHPKGSPNPFGG